MKGKGKNYSGFRSGCPGCRAGEKSANFQVFENRRFGGGYQPSVASGNYAYALFPEFWIFLADVTRNP